MWKASVAALALSAGIVGFAAPAQAQCLPMMCGFSEKGKKGPFVANEVKPKKLAKADATIEQSKADGSLAAGSIDRGDLHGAGLHMPQTELALEALVESLRPHWPYRQPGPIDVKIVASYSFSPLAHADNVIVVPLGALLRAETDDEVAWLMGHEFSHLALGHFERHAKARKREKFIGNAVSLMQGGAAIASSRYSFGSNGLQQRGTDQKLLQKLSSGIYTKSEDLRLVSALLNDVFSRKQEDQADVAGLDLAMAAGFSDSGASLAIEELGKDDEQRKNLFAAIGDDMAEFGKLEGGRLLLAATQRGGNLKAQGGSLVDNLLGNLKTIAVNKLVDHYTATHRPAEPRREGVLAYHERAYPEGELRDTTSEWLDALKANPEVVPAQAMLDARVSALALLQEGKANEAVAVLKPAMEGVYGSNPLLLNTAAQIYAEAGDRAGAEAIYSRAMGLQNTPDNPYLAQSRTGFVDHVTLLVSMGNIAKANEVIAKGTERFGDDHAFLPQKIRIAMKTRDMDQLVGTMARCTDIGDPALSADCEYALLGPEADAAYAVLTPLERAEIDKQRGMAKQKAQTGGFLKAVTGGLKSLGGGSQ
ncbi:M48 family metalloprotease [Erythrobacter litoralis]|uniref:Peptidase M48 domain-containing protein n=1 Tax=Erythrobacter litoralis (strain HTCC2594) TaxID=314225 RepID=Q2N662_ERYLH|nr:M48 family metalloprotease [Erythrobacter litoralis]ABC64829.1 hypothetical protein ELI_13685 [Erythrobacter litoralis HTCC2594]